MLDRSSKYKDDIVRLRNEGKKYREIKEILGCSMSMISYYTNFSERNKQLERSKKNRRNGKLYKSRSQFQERNRQIVQNYLKSHPCIDCGNSDIRVLEFDHVKGKKVNNISHGVREAWKVERLLEEIKKCEIRCCNCHRIVTRERRKINKNQI